ncbi:2-hydroxychromene-2-carboxylate isomerase [Caldithrix abyssi]|nr:2-hydroxychromene-2-carboxylate isomerase [Caldithrix abyssi]
MKRELKYYFDYLSPNAYIAWTQLPTIVEKFNLELRAIPVFFPGIVKACGRKGPAEIPALIKWMQRNVLRKTSLLDIPFKIPNNFPFNPLLVLRVSSLLLKDTKYLAIVQSFFSKAYAQGGDLEDTQVVSDVLNEHGLNGSELIEKAKSDECKKLLHKQTEEALAIDVFGVPTFVVGEELFWGYDDFDYLGRFLAGRDSYDKSQNEAWTQTRERSTFFQQRPM